MNYYEIGKNAFKQGKKFEDCPRYGAVEACVNWRMGWRAAAQTHDLNTNRARRGLPLLAT